MKVEKLDKLPVEKVSHNPKIPKKVFIHKGQIPHITQYAQASFPPGEVADAHSHSDMYEVFTIHKGKGLMVVNNQKIPVEPGTCVMVEQGETHEVTNTGKKDLVLSVFGITKE